MDGDIVEALQQLPRGTTDGDCIHEVLGFNTINFLVLYYASFYLLIVIFFCFNILSKYYMILSFALH